MQAFYGVPSGSGWVCSTIRLLPADDYENESAHLPNRAHQLPYILVGKSLRRCLEAANRDEMRCLGVACTSSKSTFNTTIPVITQLPNEILSASNEGVLILLDTISGSVILDPDAQIVAQYQRSDDRRPRLRTSPDGHSGRPGNAASFPGIFIFCKDFSDIEIASDLPVDRLVLSPELFAPATDNVDSPTDSQMRIFDRIRDLSGNLRVTIVNEPYVYSSFALKYACANSNLSILCSSAEDFANWQTTLQLNVPGIPNCVLSLDAFYPLAKHLSKSNFVSVVETVWFPPPSRRYMTAFMRRMAWAKHHDSKTVVRLGKSVPMSDMETFVNLGVDSLCCDAESYHSITEMLTRC